METSLEERRGSATRPLKPAPSFSRSVTFHYVIQDHTTRMQKISKAFKVYRLTVLTLICVIAGLTIGLISRPYARDWTERQFMYIEMPGELYLRLLKLMIIPLLVSNVILSFGTIQGKLFSHLGTVASFFYLGSNTIAITLAIIIALIMNPGGSSNNNKSIGLDVVNPIMVDNNHYFGGENHESIKRYRDYHPMFYHTDKLEEASEQQEQEMRQKQQQKQSQYYFNSDSQPVVEEYLNESRTRPVGQQHHGRGSSIEDSNGSRGDQYLSTGSSQQTVTHQIGLSTKLPIDVLLDVLRNLVPDSLIGATMRQTRTKLFAPKELLIGKNGTTNPPPSRWPMGHEMVEQANIIGLLAISVLTGVVLSHMEEAAKPVLELCACVSELSLRIGMMLINLTPFCIMSLVIGQVARSRDLSSIAGELCKYSMTVIIALLIYGAVLLPLIYYLITKKSPFQFFMSLLEALVASFATSSSSATMALTLNCLTALDLNPVIIRAFGPLGSVFNMNGTAIYEAVGAIFIAQSLGVTLPLTSLLLVGLGSAVASLSTAGIPSSGIMTMVIVLNAINLPVLQLSLIYIVDFIIDRFRTVINVWSGAIVCGLINHICPEQLFEEEMKPEKYREMQKFRGSKGHLHNGNQEPNLTPQVISVTITPPSESSSRM